jgi:cytochrome c5
MRIFRKIAMLNRFINPALVAFFCVAVTPAAASQHGESVYKIVCAACHGTGVLGSPKIGDKKAWSPLIKEGQEILTAHGYVGVRNMPAKGGKPDLTVEGFASALVFMVNKSGGQWREPNPEQLKNIRIEIAKRERELSEKSKKTP